MLHAQERAEHVRIEGGRVALGGLLRQWTGLAFGTGGIDRDIQPAKPFDRLIDEATHLVLVAYIGGEEFGLSAQVAEFGYQLVAFFLASARNNGARALLREGQGSGPSDTGQGARDQNNGGFHGGSSCKNG